jgi:predicted nucleic-acid-binding Zn-ribbon protein
MGVRAVRRVEEQAACPKCRKSSPRHAVRRRRLPDLGSRRSMVIELTTSYHRCPDCGFFLLPADDLIAPGTFYAKRVMDKAIELVSKEGLSVGKAVKQLRERFHVKVPRSTLYRWLR